MFHYLEGQDAYSSKDTRVSDKHTFFIWCLLQVCYCRMKGIYTVSYGVFDAPSK